MKIAQVAPLYESVPPKYYGGTERVVAFLTEELVRLGHDVTLFASGDSVTRAALVPGCARALRLARCCDPMAPHVYMLEQVFQRADEFDIVHFHADYLHLPLARRRPLRQVTSLHGRLDLPEIAPLYREFRSMPFVSVSHAQRAPLPFLNWQATVHHGLPRDMLRFAERGGDYLAFLGRLSPEKGPERAIAIAKAVGMPLKIAAKVDPADQEYFDAAVRPLLDHPLIDYIGEIGDADKGEFLGNARALLFPIEWPEPFGLVMIEAMACGTPVIAFGHGSVPEVMLHGRTGFVVNNVAEAAAAVRRLDQIDRRACRAAFESRFTAERMARDYLSVYEQIVAAGGELKTGTQDG